MSENVPSANSSLLLRFLILLILMAVAGGAGLWLGKWSVPEEQLALPKSAEGLTPAKPQDKKGIPPSAPAVDPDAPPLYFSARLQSGDDWATVSEEVALAAASGIHQFIVPVSLQWLPEENAEIPLQRIKRFVDVDTKATFLVQIDVNPSEGWLKNHPGDQMVINGAPQPFSSAASQQWLEDARVALATLMEKLEGGEVSKRIAGYVLTALLEGQWLEPLEYDRSEVNRQGFRDWLIRRYQSEEGLRTAWSNAEIQVAAVDIPAKESNNDTTSIFFSLPEAQPQVDFLRYTSEITGDALAALASHVASKSAIKPIILAPYGHSLEQTANAAGHFALGNLLESNLDGFLSPVAYDDRGLGGAGGFMGPVHSLIDRGRKWFIIDDTRTGIGRDATTGQFARMRGVRPEDIFDVQHRNFAAALVHGLGVVWSDPMAEGWLHDKEQWEQCGKMYEAYRQYRPNTTPGAAGELTGVTVLVDEGSRFLQRCDTPVNSILLTTTRDAVLRAGTPVRFSLLQDFVDDIAPPTPVYCFLNAFHISPENRQRIHERLAREKAIAIWLYAPGYFAEKPETANITATTGINVKAFDGAAKTGSVFLLSGQYLPQNAIIGATQSWNPLFYVDDNDADVLARYQDSNKGSIALKPQESGWTSVFLAEPSTTPPLWAELLRILEQPLYFPPADTNFYDTVYAGNNLLAFHAGQAGKRTVAFSQFYDIQDLFDSAIGWMQKDGFLLQMHTGETRLFTLKNIADQPGRDVPPGAS